MTREEDSTALLRSDVKKLGNILGEILLHHGGQELFDKVEIIREMTKSIRSEYDKETYNKLKAEIAELQPPLRQQVIRAFSIYFHLINIAEQNHRIRKRREYLTRDDMNQPFSIDKAVANVNEFGLSNEQVKEVLDTLSIELIITAHPTEATKRTVLEIQKRISEILQKINNPLTNKKELIISSFSC